MKHLLKNLTSILCAGLLVISAGAAVISCAPSSTATAQIAEQTKDPNVLAKAAYLDALRLYNDLADRYIKYAGYMETNFPTEHGYVITIFGEMDDVLMMWEGFAQVGVIPEKAPEKMDEYADAILTLLLALDAAIESGEIEF